MSENQGLEDRLRAFLTESTSASPPPGLGDGVEQQPAARRVSLSRLVAGAAVAAAVIGVAAIALATHAANLRNAQGHSVSSSSVSASQGAQTGPQRLTGAAPTPRFRTAMAYDGFQHEAVLFGGAAGVQQLLDDTWTFQGRTWTRRDPLTHPGPLADDLMVYDDRTHTCLLVGSGTQGLTETWSWDGTTWTQLADLGIGHLEYLQALAFDPTAGQVVLLTHVNDSSGATTETRMWTWDGHTWTLRHLPQALPVALDAPLLTTVGAASSGRIGRGVLALFGTADGSRETWLWNGSTWSKLAAGDTPPYDRLSPTMAEDPATGNVVLIGTGDAAGGSRSTWLWDGSTWSEGAPAPVVESVFDGSFVLTDSASSHAIMIGEPGPDDHSNRFDVLWTFDGRGWVSDRPA